MQRNKKESRKNTLVSPLSVMTALAMTQNGGRRQPEMPYEPEIRRIAQKNHTEIRKNDLCFRNIVL